MRVRQARPGFRRLGRPSRLLAYLLYLRLASLIASVPTGATAKGAIL